jgi:hypothetical protein
MKKLSLEIFLTNRRVNSQVYGGFDDELDTLNNHCLQVYYNCSLSNMLNPYKDQNNFSWFHMNPERQFHTFTHGHV